MKKIFKDKILNVEGTDRFDNTFLFEYLLPGQETTSPPTPLQERGADAYDTREHLFQADHRLPYNKALKERRRELKQNLTLSEKKIWQEVLQSLQRKYNIRILQQRIVGDFIVDFYASTLRLVIEIDGESHFDEQGKSYDEERTSILQGYGLDVLRFTNDEVKDNILGVEKKLENYIQNSPLLERGWGRGPERNNNVEIIYLRDLLQAKKNPEILERVKEKPAMYSEVYSPKDELEIFTELFENAISENKKIHIIGVTLGEEIKMLEEYYQELGFVREDINAFDVDFSVPLVTVSCHIENLMWRGSDYKAQRDAIFFCPPIRESGQNKAIFKGITRGVIAGIDMSQRNHVGAPLVGTQDIESTKNTNSSPYSNTGHPQGMPLQYKQFIGDCIREEKILPLFMGKVLKYNLEDVGLEGDIGEFEVEY